MLFLLACAEPTPPDVILISLDTVRADALSAYGLPPAGRTDLLGTSITPNLDALAASGRRYRWAFAHAPSTLASHATVFTGLDPHALSIPKNGYPLLAGPPLLAEAFVERGYSTLAVLGSSALARPMGVDRGFATWDEQFTIDRTRRFEASADHVTDRALSALRAAPAPKFAFVHYFDAHGPYAAPPLFAGRWNATGEVTPERVTNFNANCRAQGCDADEQRAIQGAYLEEVAWVDQEVGRLLAEPVGPAGRVVVVFADHGEMLGEERLRAVGHGADVDPPVTHVPLIVAGHGVQPEVIDEVLGLRDIRAVIGGVLGWGTETRRPVPMEATQPGGPPPAWNNRGNERGWVQGESVLVSGQEGVRTTSLEGAELPVDVQLEQALRAWDKTSPPYRAVSMASETEAGLKALGYLD